MRPKSQRTIYIGIYKILTAWQRSHTVDRLVLYIYIYLYSGGRYIYYVECLRMCIHCTYDKFFFFIYYLWHNKSDVDSRIVGLMPNTHSNKLIYIVTYIEHLLYSIATHRYKLAIIVYYSPKYNARLCVRPYTMHTHKFLVTAPRRNVNNTLLYIIHAIAVGVYNILCVSREKRGLDNKNSRKEKTKKYV